MNTTYGETSPPREAWHRTASIRFHTEHFPLKWSDCSLTADFFSHYYAGVLAARRSNNAISELTHSISYMANELIENAIKFRTTGDVEIEGGLDNGDFLLRIANWISPETAGKFSKLLEEITSGDPGDLLIQRIEANAADENSGGSGLGLLTLMNDYGVRLWWSFSQADRERVHLETIARLTLPAEIPDKNHGN